MGNSLSQETTQRQVETQHLRTTNFQHALDPGTSRQIKVCLMSNASVDDQTAQGESSAGQGVASSQQAAWNTYGGHNCPEGQQKVLSWNCNPSDTTGTTSGYTAWDTAGPTGRGLQTPVTADLSSGVLPRSARKHAAGDDFDMHPAVSSHVAGSVPRSSSSSSVSSSFRSRGFSFDETMPHGPEPSSDDEADLTPSNAVLPPIKQQQAPETHHAAESKPLPSLAQQDLGIQTGRLHVHPRTRSAAEQVVWVLKGHQLTSRSPAMKKSSATTTAAAASVHCTDKLSKEVLVSPAFPLPCTGDALQQQATSDWCLMLRPTKAAPLNSSSSGGSACSPHLQLGLALREAPLHSTAAASAAAASIMSDRQAPGSPLATAGGPPDAAAIAVEVHCVAKVSVVVNGRVLYTQQQDSRHDKKVYHKLSTVQDLPLVWSMEYLHRIVDGQQQQQDDRAKSAAARGDVEVHIAVEFNAVELICRESAKASSSRAPQQQQQQPQWTEQLPSADTNKQLNSSSSSSSSTVNTRSSSAAAEARQLEAVLLSTSPRLLVIDRFFDDSLCDELMQLAAGRLVRSRVASGSETPSRTSWSHFFVKDAARQSPIVDAESQIEALFKSTAVRGHFPPLTKVEALQVVKYHLGEFYHEHYDNRADAPLTRAATIIVYLCDTEEGGATSFPRAVTGWSESSDWQLPPKVTVGADGQGIKVFPAKGRALVFWSKRADGSEDPNSIHAADTVIKGEKWITTRWMKDY